MLFRILKRDLKRKKTMNFILFTFILLAALFMASSVSNLATITGAIDYFIEISKVPDYFTISLGGKGEDRIEDFLGSSKYVKEYDVINGINLTSDQIEKVSIKDKELEGKDTYVKTNMLYMQPLKENFMKVYDRNGKPLQLKNGEIGIPRLEAEENHLSVGDRISITIQDIKQEFTIGAIFKDVVFGSSMMGFKRFIITESDFKKYEKQEDLTFTRIYCINYYNKEAFQKNYKAQNFNVIADIEKSLIKMCYVFDMLVAGILMIVSICLILIAFLVLRFTIVFTLQEDYKEIGVMKAIGIREQGIKVVYLAKYFVIAVFGAAVGLVFSIPFGEMLLENAIVNIVTQENEQNILLNIGAAVLVVLMVIGFCNICANRLKKFSAMDAIRNGSNGERYKNHLLSLSKYKRMSTSFFMAFNDVLSHKKRFAILGITFCIGTMLVLLPLVAASTLKSKEIVYSFGIWPSDVYMDNGKAEQYVANKNRDEIYKDLKDIQTTLERHGLSAKAGTQMGFIVSSYSHDSSDLYSFHLYQPEGDWEQEIKMLDGKVPELKNEIAITDMSAADMGVGIGDSIYLRFLEYDQEYIVTGTFQTMMNMGKGVWVGKKAEIDLKNFIGIMAIQIEVDGMESKEVCERLVEIFPNNTIANVHEFLNSMIGGIMDQLDSMIWLITAIVLMINVLITILMMKIFIIKERSDIALLKSIGFRNRAIKVWQAERIIIILCVSILVGTIASNVLAPYIIGPIFAMMGANKMKLIMDPWKGYVIYPLILFVITSVSAVFCTGTIKRIDVKEINNME